MAVAPTHARLAAFRAGGLDVEVHLWDIPYLVPFRIARPDPNEESSRTAFVHLTDRASGIEGWGEGCADPYYGDTPETIAAVAPLLLSVALPALSAALAAAGGAASESGYASARGLAGMAGRAADALAPMSDAMDIALGNHGAAKSAIEQALHDLLARSATTSLRRWLGGPETMGHTNLTIGIAPIDVMVERAAAATRYPSLKLKVGLGGEEELIRRVREVYHGPLRLDANCGWTLERALELLPLFERSNVELLEQPLRPGRIKNMAALAAATEIPVIADEDCIVYDNIEQLVGLVDGVNLKQVKIGGLGPSLRGFRKAESLGLRRMFGSMVETKLGIAGAAAVAGAAEFLDLDGPIGLIGDPFTGLELDDQCRWILDDNEPGSGVTFNPTARG
ncbi:MAG: enolase C-terminal domain-like protein [Chloroflexota bacterium]